MFSRGTDSHYKQVSRGHLIFHVLQFKFAPATTRAVAGRKPGENALAMGSSARLKDAVDFPSDSVVSDAQPSELDGFNGTHSKADFEGLI